MPVPKGQRYGGKPKGYKAPKTLEKERARELQRQRILAKLGPLTDAQIANAQGLSYLVIRDKRTGKFLRVSQAMATHQQHLEDSEEVIEVWEKDPCIQAFTDLMNRALDKPIEQHQHSGPNGGPIPFTWQPPQEKRS